MINQKHIDDYNEDGACLVRGLATDWLDELRSGVALNEADPGPMAEDVGGKEGRFFGDYCNWRRIEEYDRFIRQSELGRVSALLTGSSQVRMFHEHLLIKEPGTTKKTPWHQDLPYYNVDGNQTISFWIALDPVDQATCPQFVAGSHRWGKLYYPRLLATSENYGFQAEGYESVPDIDAAPESYNILSWELAPGDALCFNYKTLHGAPANHAHHRRRGLAIRLVGDDVRYAQRPGDTSPPMADIGLSHGDPLSDDHFPVIWPSAALSSHPGSAGKPATGGPVISK